MICYKKDSNLEKIFPENISILETKYKNGCVTINFSSEFANIEEKNIIIEGLEKTLKELTEVTQIKILIEGNEFQDNLTQNNKENFEDNAQNTANVE